MVQRSIAPSAAALGMVLALSGMHQPVSHPGRARRGWRSLLGAGARRSHRRPRGRRTWRRCGCADRWRGGRRGRRRYHAAAAAARVLLAPPPPPPPATTRLRRPATEASANIATGAPTHRCVGAEQSAQRRMLSPMLQADAPSRSDVTYRSPSAKHGMVGPGTGNGSLLSNAPDGEMRLMQPADGPADQ